VLGDIKILSLQVKFLNIFTNMIPLNRLSIRILILSVFFTFSFNLTAQDNGEQLFLSSGCTSCHTIGGGKLIGPDLKDVLTHDRFVNEKDQVATFIRYVQNPIDFGVKDMPSQPLDEDQIKAILQYIISYVPEEIEETSNEEVEEKEESGINTSLLLIIGIIILFILIFALTSIKNILKKTQNQETETVLESIIKFCKIYWAIPVLVLGTLVFPLSIYLLNVAFNSMMGIGVVEKYQPSQPIEFSHKIHAGDNGIDCNYCHSSARNSKTAGVPSVNVCMNCHTTITKGTNTGEKEIQKIHEAINNNTPIEWVRVHQLPDLTYFNHSQHVTVGDLECQQCHGNMQEKTVGQVATMEELNTQAFNEKDTIIFKHPTLTMGWCIDCHKQKEISLEDNNYYTEMHAKMKEKYGCDAKLTIDKMGGLECGKCHY